MIKGEEKAYKNSLNNMVNSLQDTWKVNQKLLKMKIKGLENKISRIEPQIKGVKTQLKTETEYMTRTIAESRTLRKGLEEFFNDIDLEDLKKVRQICQILNGYCDGC